MNMRLNTESELTSELVEALLKAQEDIGHAHKNASGQIGQNRNYKYADLEEVINTVRDAFTKNGLVISQPTDVLPSGQAVVVTIVLHKSGQYIKGLTPIINTKNDAQGLGSAITYARRYGLAAIANITQSDDDGATAGKKAAAPRAVSKPVAAPTKAKVEEF